MTECSPVHVAFFRRLVPLVRPMATRLEIDEDYLLALCAFEDAWASDAHNDRLHNLFGITKAGGRDLAFPSDDACCAFWEAHYGSVVKGSKTFAEFTIRIRSIGYNSINPQYDSQLRDVYYSVLRRKKICGQ